MRKSFRLSSQVPNKNLHIDHDDFREFEPFEGETDLIPRSTAPGTEPLTVVGVDMRKDFNEANHYTTEYVNNLLVVRRAQQFVIDITCNRPMVPQDDFQLEFLIGADPAANKDSLVVVTFGNRTGTSWSGEILEARGTVLSLGITANAKAIVGLYRMYVAVVVGNGMQRTEKDPNTNFYLLFNPWSPDDEVFYPDEIGRTEYVLNSTGLIYMGTPEQVSERGWVYGQFEEGVLDACIYIMDVCRMPIQSRGEVTKMVRTASALINSQDDNGVLVGNWSDDFSMGTPPTTWTGSTKILLQYHNTGAPVSFAQCWVYAGVLNTFLRCLGIPSRVISNFNSAHDNTGNLKTELVFKEDGTPDRRNTRDSIWNYHCWNEAFMKRVDLPPKFSGWQVVDATPQETSDGYFRCGPAPVIAIRDGELCHPFDCGFVFAEVNSDLIHMVSDKYGNMTPKKVDTTYIGKMLYTKAVSSWGPEDITGTYKHPEGSAADKETMAKAEQYGCARDQSDFPASKLAIQISVQAGFVGEPLKIEVTFYNQAELMKSVKAHMEITVTYYTGVASSDPFKSEDFTLDIAAFQNSTRVFEITPQQYVSQLGSNSSLEITVTGKSDDEEVSEVKTISLKLPPLNITLSGQPQVNQEMYAVVSFTNTLSFPLTGAKLAMEGAGLLETQVYNYRTIPPMGQISRKVGFRPLKPGLRTLLVLLDCENLPDVTTMVEIKVMP
ncbi:coagulation factor XIII A chain [Fundulus heteroclitus]|uniref:coagulation factor XIII A chain n=1 Tax=Fundulus heteroclitus TaxID=8078 RepID=UPI00165C1896|nr:coagulation factor XIII A chain [Fundulus heteroclitus]